MEAPELTAYELERQRKMEENKRRLQELNLQQVGCRVLTSPPGVQARV